MVEDRVVAGSPGASGGSRETLLAQTFVDIADTLVADFDIVDFLTVLTNRCVQLFDLSEAGLLLADALGHVRVVASSSHRMELLELFELQHDEGPCLDCYRDGRPVRCDDLHDAIERWPRFAPEALAAGWNSVYAVPMRLRHETIGSLNLLRAQATPLAEADFAAAQALADVATIGILQYRATEVQRVLAQQLQHALDSRVAVEQAKGVLAQHGHIGMEAAFAALRRYARDHNQRLADVACAVVDRTLAADEVTPKRS